MFYRMQLVDRASIDVALRLWRERENGAEERRALAGYSKLLDGLLGMGCHPYQQVALKSCQTMHTVGKRFGFMIKARLPRMLAVMDLSDATFASEPHGIPIAEDLVNDAKGNARLAELLVGVMVHLAANFNHVVIKKTHMYNFVRKYTAISNVVAGRLEPDKLVMLNSLLEQGFDQFRQRYRIEPFSEENRAMVLFLLRKLQGDGGGQGAGETDSNLHWRNKLMIVWFLMNFVGEDEISDPDLAMQIWRVAVGLVEGEVTGMPVQRCGLGLLGRFASLVNATPGALTDELHSEVESYMVREEFCEKLVFALAAAHRESGVGRGGGFQGSPAVQIALRDASRKCGGQQVFPTLRHSLFSYSFKTKHSMLVREVMEMLGEESRMTCALHMLEKCKVLAASPPSEDQQNFHTSAAEVFGGLCKALLGDFGGEANAAEKWGIMIPYLDVLLEGIFQKAIDHWADGIRFGIHRVGVTETRPVLNLIVEKILRTLWSEGGGNAGGGSEEGFASQSKWMKLLQPILTELSHVEPKVDSVEAGLKEMAIDGGSEVEEVWGHLRESLLPRLLAAVNHPFNTCRRFVGECLHALSGLNSGARYFGLSSNMDAIVSRFHNVLSPDVEKDKKKNAKETLCIFLINCLHLGDVKDYYADAVLPLLELTFKTLGDFETDGAPLDAAGATGEASTAQICRQTIGAISGNCCALYMGGGADVGSVIESVGRCCDHPAWQVRQAASVFLGRLAALHKFIITPGQSTAIFHLFCGLQGDARREVSRAATEGVVGMLAVMSANSVMSLVNQYAAVANKSLRPKKRRKGASSNAVSEAPEVAAERERKQRISTSVLMAAVHSAPYDVPPFVPVAIAALSKHR